LQQASRGITGQQSVWLGGAGHLGHGKGTAVGL